MAALLCNVLRLQVSTAVRCAAAGLLALTSCVSSGESSARWRPQRGDDSDALARRAEQLWIARRDLDCPTAYQFESPGERETTSEAEFVARCQNDDPLRVLRFSLKGTEIDGSMGWVHVAYDVRFRKVADAPVENVDIWEKWHDSAGEWLPVPRKELSSYPEPPSLRNAHEEVRLKDRFAAAWEARSNADWHRLYELTDPRDRQAVTEAMFVEAEGIFRYLGRELHWVEVIGEEGRVRVTYEHKVADPSLTKLPPRELAVTEHWVKHDGEWFRDLKRP